MDSRDELVNSLRRAKRGLMPRPGSRSAPRSGEVGYGSEPAARRQQAVDSRDVIGHATGVLVRRFTVDDEEPFPMAVRSSRGG